MDKTLPNLKAPTVKLESFTTTCTAFEMLGADFFIMEAKFDVECSGEGPFPILSLWKFLNPKNKYKNCEISKNK